MAFLNWKGKGDGEGSRKWQHTLHTKSYRRRAGECPRRWRRPFSWSKRRGGERRRRSASAVRTRQRKRCRRGKGRWGWYQSRWSCQNRCISPGCCRGSSTGTLPSGHSQGWTRCLRSTAAERRWRGWGCTKWWTTNPTALPPPDTRACSESGRPWPYRGWI